MKREILYSPGYGAGWSSWARGDVVKFMLAYQPLIDAIKRGEEVWTDADEHNYSASIRGIEFHPSHPAMQSFVNECEAKFSEVPFLGGARDLTVESVNGPFRIEEYDGFESVEYAAEASWITLDD